MRHARVLRLSSLAFIVGTSASYAQTNAISLPDNPRVELGPLEINLNNTRWGDAEAGKTKSSTCIACHGVDGNPPIPIYPRLAGQSELYLAEQLVLYATHQRTSGMAAVMMSFSQNLSGQDMRDIGAYFSVQKAGADVADESLVAEGPYKGMKFYEIGQHIFRGGDAKRGIPACMSCHGPSGAGNPGPPYPQIGGQPQDYVVRRLQEYQSGVTAYKKPAHFKIMTQVTKPLTEQEIQALGSYIQGLHRNADDPAEAKVGVKPTATVEPNQQS